MEIDYMKIPDGPGKDELEQIMKFIPKLNLMSGPWIAGGAVRRLVMGESLQGGDVDIFFPSYTEFGNAKSLLDKNAKLEIKTNHALTYLVDVGGFQIKCQIINRRTYVDIAKLFSDFDFSVCQFATDGECIAYPPESLQDLKERRLRFSENGKGADRTSPSRLVKYCMYGFVPEDGVLATTVNKGLNGIRTVEIFAASRFSDSNYSDFEEVEEPQHEDDLEELELKDASALERLARALFKMKDF